MPIIRMPIVRMPIVRMPIVLAPLSHVVNSHLSTYHRHQNKWYPQDVGLSEKLQHFAMKFDCSNKFDLLLWANKFATAKIECSFEMGKQTPLGGSIYFAGDCSFIHR